MSWAPISIGSVKATFCHFQSLCSSDDTNRHISSPYISSCIACSALLFGPKMCLPMTYKPYKNRSCLMRINRVITVLPISRLNFYHFDSWASLKKRIQTRSGDSIEYKLANDIYCLVCVLDGADWDDVREVLNIPRSSKRSQSQSNLDSSFYAYPLVELDQLRRSIQVLTADMVAVKQENSIMKSELLAESKSLRNEVTQMKADSDSELSEIPSQISTNALSIHRICDEKSNGTINIKSELKQIKSDV